MASAFMAEELLGTMSDEESGSTVVRARLTCGCIMEKMVPNEKIVLSKEGVRSLAGKYPCASHRGVKRR